MIVVLLVIIVILLLYVGRVAEHAMAKVDAATVLLRKQAEQGSKEKQRGLDYEWDHEEWPKWSDDAPEDRAWVPYTNPRPYTSQDAYSVALLKSEVVASADAREMKRFLRRAYQTLGAYLPDAVCDAIISHTDASVRAWAASHVALVRKDYSQLDRNTPDFFQVMASAPITRDYQAALRNDHELLVRAALLSNPDNSKRFSGWGGVTQDWKQELKSLSLLERLALMRNPDISVSLPLAMMKESPTELVIDEGEYAELVSVAVLSPNLIEGCASVGRRITPFR